MNQPRRNEHPRPDRVRENWCTLNGRWDFAFDRENVGRKEKWYREGGAFDLKIEVPFCYQCELSGINSQEHVDVIWYRRTFEIPANLHDKRRLLHFGAVDYKADVWLDGQYLGGHEGGYTPFTFDVTDIVACEGEHTVVVRCEDRLDCDQPRGKQSFRPEPFECWYTPVSGIWQSVWMEGVGEYYPVDFRLTPQLETASLKVDVSLNELPKNASVRLTATFKGDLVASQTVDVTTDRFIQTVLYLRHNERLRGVHMWRPDNPALYDLKIETIVNGQVQDAVDTYFGMRKISVSGSNILLNNSTLFQRLILDQGYWADGLLTAPSDDALREDVELTIKMGYNGARKHQKFEDPRYLYWADKLGLLVWGELPSAYWLRDSEKRNMIRDMSEAIARDYNHPSLITWVPLNESWGVPYIHDQAEAQDLADALYCVVKTLDPTRLISGNDGWENSMTDFVSIHDYTAWPEELSPLYATEDSILANGPGSHHLVSCQGYDHHGKPMLLTEFGGIAMKKDEGNGNWGYNGAVSDEESLLKRFDAITQAFKHMPGFCGYCYTQLTDVFQEVNGLLDMDRKPKADLEKIREVNIKK